MIENGKTDDEIKSYLLQKSDKVRSRHDDYIGKKISKARKKKQGFYRISDITAKMKLRKAHGQFSELPQGCVWFELWKAF